MKSFQSIAWILIVSVSFGVLLEGCATKGPAVSIRIDPAFTPANMQDITVLPIVDARRDKSQPWDREEWQKRWEKKWANVLLIRPLEKKGYTVALATDFGGVDNINADDIAESALSWVHALGPEGAQWILLMTLEDLVNSPQFGTSWATSCAMILFDKNIGKAVWRYDVVTTKGSGE